MRAIKQTPIEIFVRNYLRNRKPQSVASLNLLRKASVLIQEKIESICCSDDEAVVDLFTRRESPFVKSIRSMLANMPRNGNIKSLTRTKDIIDDFIAPPCCIIAGMEYDYTATEDNTVTSDGETEETYDVTLQVEIEGQYLSDILKIDFYVDDVLTTTEADPTNFADVTFTTEVTVPISDSVTVEYHVVITYKGGTTVTSEVFSTTITDDFEEEVE